MDITTGQIHRAENRDRERREIERWREDDEVTRVPGPAAIFSCQPRCRQGQCSWNHNLISCLRVHIMESLNSDWCFLAWPKRVIQSHAKAPFSAAPSSSRGASTRPPGAIVPGGSRLNLHSWPINRHLSSLEMPVCLRHPLLFCY